MKTPLIFTAGCCGCLLFASMASAQNANRGQGAPGQNPPRRGGGITARRLTAPVTNPNPNSNNPDSQQSAPAPSSPAAPPASAVRRAPATAQPVDPEKEREKLEKADVKALELQKKRADEDYAWAQYALGMRYLNGKGVDKDPVEARKWLEKAAKNGDSQAVKKLEELDRENGPSSASPPSSADKPAPAPKEKEPPPTKPVKP